MLESIAAGVVNYAWAWILKNCRASIEPDAGAKSRVLMSTRVFAITGIKQREHVNCRIYPELGSNAVLF